MDERHSAVVSVAIFAIAAAVDSSRSAPSLDLQYSMVVRVMAMANDIFDYGY